MSQFTVSARIDGEAKGLVQAGREGKAALDDLTAATDRATVAANKLKPASEGAAAAERGRAAAGREAAATVSASSAATAGWAEAMARGVREGAEMAAAELDIAVAAQIAEQKQRAHERALDAARQAAQEAAATMSALAAGYQSSAAAAQANAVATGKAAMAQGQAANAYGLTRMQAMTLRYTMADLTASMASGMSPMMILMQQGPQVAQAFNGPRDMLSKLGGLLIGTRGLVLGLAGAVVAGIAAHESYGASVRQITVALASHGDRLGLTTQGYLDLADQIAETASVSDREGRTIMAAMIGAGVQSEAAMLKAAEAARGYAVATGQDAAQAAVALAEKLKTPGKAARELADEFNLLDEATVRQIESMERSGDRLAAQERLATALDGKFSALAEETSGWARAFEWLGNMASDAWDSVGKFLFGAPKGNQIEQVAKEIEETERAIKIRRGGGFSIHGTATADDSESQRLRMRLVVLQGVQKTLEAIGEVEAKNEARARESREIGALAQRFAPDTMKQRELADYETRLRATLATEGLDPAIRADAELALNGVLREQVELRERMARAGAQPEPKKTKEPIEAERALADAQRDRARAIEDIADRVLGLLPPHERAIAMANRWRDESLAALDATGEGYAEFAADVDAIYNGMLADAYEEDLRRRTDWAAGVQRAYQDLGRDAKDFAGLSERSIKSAAATIKDELIGAALSGEATFDRLADAFGRMILEMAYQKMLASQVESAVGWAVDLIGAAFGLTGGGSSGSSIPKTMNPVGKNHAGGLGRGPVTSVTSSMRGGSDEHLRWVHNREGVFTPHMMDNADSLIQAVASRPIVVQLNAPAGGAGASAEPRVTVNLYGAPEGTSVERRRDQNGDMTIDALMDQMEDRMAGRILQGRSPLNPAIESVYGGQRQVM